VVSATDPHGSTLGFLDAEREYNSYIKIDRERIKIHNKILIEELEGKRPLERIRLAWEDMLKYILKKLYGRLWTRFIWLRIGISGGFF
jgi:hypothetical protein